MNKDRYYEVSNTKLLKPSQWITPGNIKSTNTRDVFVQVVFT